MFKDLFTVYCFLVLRKLVYCMQTLTLSYLLMFMKEQACVRSVCRTTSACCCVYKGANLFMFCHPSGHAFCFVEPGVLSKDWQSELSLFAGMLQTYYFLHGSLIYFRGKLNVSAYHAQPANESGDKWMFPEGLLDEIQNASHTNCDFYCKRNIDSIYHCGF